MSRPLRVILSALMLAAALMSLAIAVPRTTLTYMLPPAVDGDEASRHIAWFAPAVVASVIAGVTVLVTALWTGIVYRRARIRLLWLAVLGVLAVDLVVLVVATMSPLPDF